MAKGQTECHELAFLNHGNMRRFKEIKGKDVLEEVFVFHHHIQFHRPT